MIIENDGTDNPDFLNMSAKTSLCKECKECKEAMVHLLLTPQFYQTKNINIAFT